MHFRSCRYGKFLIPFITIALIASSCFPDVSHLLVPQTGAENKVFSPQALPATINLSTPPSRILLFIGDGMGSQHRKAAGWIQAGLDGSLVMDQFPYQGFLRTASANDAVTDSAAAATAFATGFQTNNGMISVSPEGKRLTTILEYAQAKGLAVGLVTTTQISHATPAAFSAHVTDRNRMTDIATQLLEHRVNVLLGGGEDQFLPAGNTGCFPQDGERSDNRNLISEAQAVGYIYVCNSTDFDAVDSQNTDFLLGLFADEGMLRPFQPTLAEMTEKAIAVLSNNPNGFFLMIEGGQIDWASHNNDAANAIQDTIDFDQAVNIGRTYADENPTTLMIVTSDHETGGMDVHLTATGQSGEDGPFFSLEGTPFYVSWGTTGHTSADVPVSALGPNSALVSGTNQNTSVFWLMSRLIFYPLFLPYVQR